jgi:hypothetical protein
VVDLTTGKGLQERAREGSPEWIQERLSEPFPQGDLKWMPKTTKGDRALVVPFIDSRMVQERLDDVLGLHNWQSEYHELAGGTVRCRLSLRIGAEWVVREDVGGQSEQPDPGDRMKAAFSDALKRAAVQFGVGRYLYYLTQMWVPYDQGSRRFTPPQLPDWALPRKKTRPAPADGTELKRRLAVLDAQMAEAGSCDAGELVAYVIAAGQRAGQPDDLTRWNRAGIDLAITAVRTFQRNLEGGDAEGPHER